MDITRDGVWLPASESDTQGRVVGITGTCGDGTPAAVVLLDELGLKMKAADGLIFLDKDVVKVNEYSQTALDLFFQNDDDDDDSRPKVKVKVNDYSQTTSDLFFQDDDDDDEHDDDDGQTKIQATTVIMAAELRDHFELNFSDNVVVTPVLYGGRSSDGNVVAVFIMQVWT